VGLFDLLLVGGYICSFSTLVPRVPLPPRVVVIAGAVTLAYLIAAAAILAIYLAFDFFRRQLAADTHPSRRLALNTAGGALMAAPLAALGYGALVERASFRVREVDVPLAGLPVELDGFRIVQLSDIHRGTFLSRAQLDRVVAMANETQPHLAVVTGDLISSHGDPLHDCILSLARLRAPGGTFACMGNHERYAACEREAEEWGARHGIRFLRGRAVRLSLGGATVNLAGVDYQSFSQKAAYLKDAARLVVPGALNVLLSHNPDVFPIAVRQGYDLMLAGHTHGGQVAVEILDRSLNAARFFTPYVYGLFQQGKSAGYVTRGIGTIGIPVRIGASPEIALLRLRKA
jgi:predicted MPP superfamily phosphohydrolase